MSRRDRDAEGGEEEELLQQQQEEQSDGANNHQSLIQHPSRHFTPYTGRYYIHFRLRDCKGNVGFNMRFMLHSNGLCVVALDPSHILVQSFSNVFRSLSADTQRALSNAKRLYQPPSSYDSGSGGCDISSSSAQIPRICDLAEYCGAFPRKAEEDGGASILPKINPLCRDQQAPPAAGSLGKCENGADFYSLVQRGDAALLVTSVSHTVRGTRGTHNRFDATNNMAGKHKRNATYVQDEMTVCQFSVDTLLRCPKCRCWQVVQQAQLVGTAPHQPAAEKKESTTAAAAEGSKKQQQPQQTTKPPAFPDGCAVTSCSSYMPHRIVKIPVGVNSVLLDVNQTVSESFQFALSDPIGRGFLAVVQPRNDVSFSGPKSRFERVENVSEFVSPSNLARMFVADAFTGSQDL